MPEDFTDNGLCVPWWDFVHGDMLLAMASETEKANALLQLFSTASVISSLGLGVFCYLADRLLQFPFIQQIYWLRALSDNMVHGIIGLWSWAIVIGLKKKSDFTEVILAGFLSSVIDMDHFILAGSFSLKVSKHKFIRLKFPVYLWANKYEDTLKNNINVAKISLQLH